MNATISELNTTYGLTLTTDYPADFDVPVSTGMQRQGDVLVTPVPTAAPHLAPTTPVPATGCPVVQGESGGNTHAIYADDGSGVTCDTRAPAVDDLVVARLHVPEGQTAWLGHPEHAYSGIGPGHYEVKRQREMADQMRIVAD